MHRMCGICSVIAYLQCEIWSSESWQNMQLLLITAVFQKVYSDNNKFNEAQPPLYYPQYHLKRPCFSHMIYVINSITSYWSFCVGNFGLSMSTVYLYVVGYTSYFSLNNLILLFRASVIPLLSSCSYTVLTSHILHYCCNGSYQSCIKVSLLFFRKFDI
jgi:hypothetical protein